MLYSRHVSCLQTHVSISFRLYLSISFFLNGVSFEPAWMNCLFFFIYIHYRITTLYCHSFQDLSPFISHHEHWCRRMFLFIRMLLLTYSSIMDALLLLIVEVCHAMFAMIFFFSKVWPVRVLRLELQCFFCFFLKIRSKWGPALYDCNERWIMSVNPFGLSGQSLFQPCELRKRLMSGLFKFTNWTK